MSNFIKVKENKWVNINHITSIEYYPDGDGIYWHADGYYLIISTFETDEPYYTYDDKEKALDMVEKLKQHGIFLE